ncbi:hypothetical protein [Shinella sp.]|uniref:hypothetical protein n=1 Tax=Shinella sp. TaxID=1870904 RepID=UPI00301DB571
MTELCGNEQASSTTVSRPFDVNRWSDYPELNNCLTALVREIEGGEDRQRKRGSKDARRFRDAVRSLVLDLYVAWKTDPALNVAISLSNGNYTKSTRYDALFIRYTSFVAAFSGLEAAGYLKRTRNGFHDPRTGRGRVTRIKAEPKLIESLTAEAKLTVPAISQRTTGTETILLRDEKSTKSGQAKLLEYEDTAETLSMRANLQCINEYLQRHWIDIQISDAEFRSLQARMRRDHADNDRERPFIDFGHRSLVRIFNNADWNQGGRFYRGWWQGIPKAYRRYITIDGKRTVEVDYSGLHVHMLYAEAGERLDGDAYDLGNPDIDRDLIKKVFNAMLNAKERIDKPERFEERSGGLTFKQLQSEISIKHDPIKHFFNTGYGLKLQRRDSDLAEAVMLHFFRMNYICLPVHDSFLVHHALRDELKDIMSKEYTKLFGSNISVKETLGSDPILEQGIPDGYPVSMDIATMLKPTGLYAGYEQRLTDWRSYREH